MIKPNESDYTSHVAYCRALEVYCEGIETELELIKNQKPVASMSKCSLQGATDCVCADTCIDMVDVFLAPGAQPVPDGKQIDRQMKDKP